MLGMYRVFFLRNVFIPVFLIHGEQYIQPLQHAFEMRFTQKILVLVLFFVILQVVKN